MATKSTATDTDTDTDGPLIDLNEADVKKLIARGKKRGYLTYDELNAALPQDEMSSEQIEDIMSAISDMGINIVESDEDVRSEEHTSELQSLMRISYAVFCLKKKNNHNNTTMENIN